ncbi:alpha/beta-hydrolase family protein [Gordonia sp. OPL2]|uniref:alpha/beta-hydrolase family protein n=1 Tax=Gordonia sp. OPL2 TaxID=2486274 RepID=UPI0016564667|nr:alpha/beta-hydrolase family protein [Gordonia sp. OPL2]
MSVPTDPTRHPRRETALPHPLIAVAAALGAVVALWPSGLPRGPVTSGVLAATCVGLATVASLAATRHRRWRPAAAVAATVGAAATLICAALLSASWQNALRADLDVAPIGIGWVAWSIIPAVVVFVALVWLPRTTAVVAATVTALAAGYLPAAHADDTPTSPRTPAGVLYELDDGADLRQRSDELVSRWVQAGGLDRHAVVIAVPTGSGWVDATAVDGYRDRFAGDVEILAIQYADQPSWRAFVGDRAAAGRSAIALLRAVADRTATRPAGHRPEIHLYGQSLGAIGAEEARVWAATARPGTITETLLAGVPGDSIAREPGPGARRIVLANASDPIPRWSISLVWRPTGEPRDTVTIGRPVRRPPWLPVVGFVQTSADLLGSLDGTPGVGHRYGTEQTSSMSSLSGDG